MPVRYIPGRYGSREGDWGSKRGKYDYAGFGLIRPSPHCPSRWKQVDSKIEKSAPGDATRPDADSNLKSGESNNNA